MGHDEEKPLLGQASRNTAGTYIRAVIAALSCCLASGLLLGYPTIVPLVAPTGVFASGCPNGNITNCESQGLQFQNLYNVAWSATNVGIFFVGIFFDRFGARAAAVFGALLTAVGFIPLWAATMFPGRADWLLFIGFPLIQVAGMLNSFALFGLLWHFPLYQALVIGIATATQQVSALAAYALSGLVSAGLPVQWGFLVLAGFALIGAVLGYIGVPSQDEFYERAKQALGAELPRNHTNILKMLRDTWNVMWQIKGATILSFLCIGSPYIFVIFYVSTVNDYLPFMLSSDQAGTLIFVFAILVAVIGGVLTPFLGLLMDKIGPFLFYGLMAIALGLFTGTLFIASYPCQIIAMVSAIVYQAIWSTFAQRWCVFLTPPHLIGSYMGTVVAFVGILTVLVCIVIPNALTTVLTGVAFFKWPLVVMAALSNLAALITLIYLKVVGVPTTPPTPMDHWGPRPNQDKVNIN